MKVDKSRRLVVYLVPVSMARGEPHYRAQEGSGERRRGRDISDLIEISFVKGLRPDQFQRPPVKCHYHDQFQTESLAQTN